MSCLKTFSHNFHFYDVKKKNSSCELQTRTFHNKTRAIHQLKKDKGTFLKHAPRALENQNFARTQFGAESTIGQIW